MKQSVALLILTQIASGAIPEKRFVTPLGAVAGAGANTKGISHAPAADTEKFPLTVLGTEIVETGGAFSVGDTLKSDGTGRGIVWATSGAKVAMALEDSSGAGKFVEVLLIPNVA